ncbi:hypothetical protein BG004_004320 [Podila humilis]|nr:hypothetical protein BG004_004320 [Podila humilis]
MEAIVSLIGAKSVAIQFDQDSTPTLLDLKHQLADLYQIPVDQQRLQTGGGIPLSTGDNDQDDQVFLFADDSYGDLGGHVNALTSDKIRYFGLTLRMAGGKGGFGSMLRAQGGRMSSQKGPSNTDACRDLSGRRIKTVKDAKNMADYLSKEPEREKEKKESLKRKIEEKQELASRPTRKHRFEDSKFFDETEEQVEDVKNAVATAIRDSLRAPSSSSSLNGSGSSSKDNNNNNNDKASSRSTSASSGTANGKGKGKAIDVVTPVVKKPAAKKLSMWDDMSDYESSDEEQEADDDEEEEEPSSEEEQEKPIPSVGSSKARSTRNKK